MPIAHRQPAVGRPADDLALLYARASPNMLVRAPLGMPDASTEAISNAALTEFDQHGIRESGGTR